MKICAVICEYNPMHSGHLYQIAEIKKQYERLICILSGDFVQRARPAVADKYVRTEIALGEGADLVVELPAPYSFSDAQRFCACGVRIAHAMKADALSFGAECGDAALLTTLSNIQCTESIHFKETLKNTLSKGFSYPSALVAATAAAAQAYGLSRDTVDAALCQPNNILAVGYLNEINRSGIPLEPFIVKRVGAGHHDALHGGAHQSSSALRAALGDKSRHSGILPFIAGGEDALARIASGMPDEAVFDALAFHALRCASSERMSGLYSAGEGIERRLHATALRTTNLTEAINAAKTKRCTHARLRRLALECLLGVDKNVPDVLPPLRLLGIRKDFRAHLGVVGSRLIMQNVDLLKFGSNPEMTALLAIQEKAGRLYGQLTNNSRDPFYESRVIVL